MMKKQPTAIESIICNNVEQTKSLTITPKEDLNLSTPYSSSASTASTLITHASFLYGSDSNDDLIELSVNNHGSLFPLYDYVSDDNDNDNDIDIDSIPLIDRITPPPPLFINHLMTPSDDEYGEYDEYVDDDECNFYNLSIEIPSLTLSNSSPIQEQKERCTIFEICNNVTPTNICYDVTPNINGKINHESTEKRFNWDVTTNDKMYIINDYLNKHINSLIDNNLSE